MKKLFKQPGRANWYIRFWHNGEKIVQCTKTADEREAKKLLKQRLAEATLTGSAFSGSKQNKISFDEMAALIVRDYRIRNQRSLSSLIPRIEHLRSFFGQITIREITAAMLDEYRDRRMGELSQFKKSAETHRPTNGTINREFAAFKRMFKLARAKELIDKIPTFPVPLVEENVREGFVERANFEGLLEQMPSDLRDPLKFLYLSAWRCNEMRSLEWRDVDLANSMISLRPANSKNKKSRQLPLDSPELLAITLRARAARRLDCSYVFHRDGIQLKPSMFRKKWRRAAQRIGMPNILIHDLRRSGIRNLVRAGVSETVAMKLSGHRTASVFRRYNITDERDLRTAMQKLQAYLDEQPKHGKVTSISIARGQLNLGSDAGVDAGFGGNRELTNDSVCK